MQNPTPYHDVNRLLMELLSRVQAVLDDEFVGLYLYGSLASGGFDAARSDIDFVVVTHDHLPQDKIDDLERVHHELWDGDLVWAKKLEGQYIPLGELRRYKAQGPEMPTVNEGRFYMAGQGSDWVIQRYVLREQETIVAGPSIREYIDPVDSEDIRQAVKGILEEWWAPMLDDPAWLVDRPDYQAFAVQTMCRVLYMLYQGEPGSKVEASRWAAGAIDEAWRPLIAEAMAWTPGKTAVGVRPVVDFIRYTVEQARNSG